MPRKLIIHASLLLIFFIPPFLLGEDAGSDISSEYYIKAAYIYNFAKFMTWPEDKFEDPGTPFRFCILGESPFGDATKTIEGKKVGKRKFIISHHKDVSQVKSCQILYICSSEKKKVRAILKKLEGAPCLTVSDIEGFARNGGMVNFIYEKKKIYFEINVENISASNLKVSSRLLRIARVVKKNATKE